MKIITSNSSRGAYHGVLEEIKKHLGDGNTIVIAPDRFTASVERGLISSLGLESSFGIEVMSFTRLADKLLGQNIAKCLTPEGCVMLIGKVIADKRNELKYYSKVALLDGFASELYAALTAIRNSGITTSALRKAGNDMPVALRLKTEDLALIYDGYLEELSKGHSDSSTRLEALAEFIQKNPDCVADSRFYITDIYDFSVPELNIISELAAHAAAVCVGMPCGYDYPNRRIYPDRMTQKLKRCSKDKVEITDRANELCAPIDAISRNLFAYSPNVNRVENEGKVVLRRAANIREEVLALAMDIIKGVRDGKRFKDYEVFASDLNEYASEIKATFARYGIPFFIDKKELLSEQTKVRYILGAISCVRTGMRRKEVLDFVKNPMFWLQTECGQDGIFTFENYVLKYNIDFGRFTSQFTISNHEYQIGDFNSQKCNDKHAIEELNIAESVRIRLNAILEDIRLGKTNVANYADGAFKVLAGAETAWRTHVDKLSTLSAYYVKCAEQVDKKIADVLNEIKDALEIEVDIDGFGSIFESMLKTLKIALVPTYLDCVFIGDIDSRFMGQGDIYVIGADNEKLPRMSLGGTVLTSRDEEMFSKLNLDISPNERQRAMMDMYAVLDLMKKPHGKLVISYAELANGVALRQSSIISELAGILCEDGQPLTPVAIDFDSMIEEGGDDAALLFSTEKSGYYEALRNVAFDRAPISLRPAYMAAYECMSDAEKSRIENALDMPTRILMPEGGTFDASTNVSRLETFYKCPYRHYFKYILSLKKRKNADLEGTEAGTIIHSMLEHMFKDVQAGRITCKDDVSKFSDGYFDFAIRENAYDVMLGKPDSGRMLLRVKAEGKKVCEDVYEISQRSQFKPAMLEARIGEGNIRPMSLSVDGKTVALRGIIDRVDVLDDMFYVVDYKTFRNAGLDFKDVYYGRKIQLYLYMRAVRHSLALKPVGVFYLPIYANFSDENVTRYRYCGQASEDTEVLKKIDSHLEFNDSVIKINYSRNGKINPEKHLSCEEFDEVGKYAERVAAKGALEIAAGYIRPAPSDGECKFCDYSDICAFAGQAKRVDGDVKLTSFKEEKNG